MAPLAEDSCSRGGMVITFGVLLATGVIRFKSLFSGSVVVPEGMVIVPDLEGMDKDNAFDLLDDSKLIAAAGGNAVSEFIEAGKIVYQTPAGGSYLDIGSTVALTISSGNGEVLPPLNGESFVPFVVWDSLEDAAASNWCDYVQGEVGEASARFFKVEVRLPPAEQ